MAALRSCRWIIFMNLLISKELGVLQNSRQVPIPTSHSACMVCGENDSLALQFQGNDNGVAAFLKADPRWQGYRGVLHGGMISTLLDAAMTHCLFYCGVEAMTADLQIRFIKPVPCSQMLELRAELLTERRSLYQLCAQLLCNGEVMARGEAKFMRCIPS